MLSYSFHPSFKSNASEEILRHKKMHYLKFQCLSGQEGAYLPIFWHLYFNCSNGLAAGNTYEEAILQALCEVVERNNVIETRLRNLKYRREIVLDTDYKPLRDMSEVLHKQGITPIIEDWSCPIPIPTMHCRFGPRAGYGTSTSPIKSAIRAITEMVQDYAINEKHCLPPQENIIYPPADKKIELSKIKSLERQDILSEIKEIVSTLNSMGYQTYVRDISLQIPVPTVLVVVPGLKCYDFRNQERHLLDFKSNLVQYYNDYLIYLR